MPDECLVGQVLPVERPSMAPRRRIALGSLAAALILGCVLLFSAGGPSIARNNATTTGLTSKGACTKCTFEQCAGSMCDPDAAPFECTKVSSKDSYRGLLREHAPRSSS